MGEESAGVGVPLGEASDALEKVTSVLRQIHALSLDHLALLIVCCAIAYYIGRSVGSWNLDEKVGSAVYKEQEKLAAAQLTIGDLTAKNRDLEKTKESLTQQVAALSKERDERTKLEETVERDPPILQLKREEFLRKAESTEDSPEQTRFRRESEDKLILDWPCTLVKTIGAKSSRNRGLQVRFDDSDFYSDCYLSDPKQVDGFELTDPGTPLKLTKGKTTHVNVGYMQMAKCQIVR
jgi:hypothetical protein